MTNRNCDYVMLIMKFASALSMNHKYLKLAFAESSAT